MQDIRIKNLTNISARGILETQLEIALIVKTIKRLHALALRER